MNEPYLDKLPEGVIDLRPLIDDKRVLRNPHKGWYVHYVDNGFIRKIYRDGIEPGDYLEDMPGLNHLYLRMDWSDIEPEEGCFRWNLIDDIMSEWGAHDFRFAFRFCCFTPSIEYSTPRWVRDAGAEGTMVPVAEPRSHLIPAAKNEKWEPDYGDPIFLEKLENFIAACAKRYDGNPLLEFIDVGSFGTYGEGHTGSGSNKVYPASVIRQHLDIHLRHFRKTTILMNDDLFSTSVIGSGLDEAWKLANYAAAKGMGARDDSICVSGYVKQFGYDTLKSAQFFDRFSETAPVDLEFAHFHLADETAIAEGLPLIEALRRTHASYAGFHHYPRQWRDRYPYLFPYIANHLGYWYFPLALEANEFVSGMSTYCRLHIENRGFARAYNPFTLVMRAVSDDKSYTLYSEEGANLGWEEGKKSLHRMKLDFYEVPSGEYRLELGLFEGSRPIEFAVKENYMHDGFAVLGSITVTGGQK